MSCEQLDMISFHSPSSSSLMSTDAPVAIHPSCRCGPSNRSPINPHDPVETISFFAILFCILSTCLGVSVRHHLSQLDFSPRGILDAILYNAPQAKEQRRRQQANPVRRTGDVGGQTGYRRGDGMEKEESYEMMNWGRVGQGRRGL